MKKTLVILIVAAMLLALLPATALAAGTTWNVSSSAELATALASADDGDTILISDSEYDLAKTTITKDITIVGESEDGVVLKPTADTTGAKDDTGAWIVVSETSDLALKNLTLNGQGHGIAIGIIVHGTIYVEDVTFCEIKRSGYLGLGIVHFGDGITIRNVTMSEIGRVGIFTASGPLDVDGYNYTGKGDIDCLDYAIEVGSRDWTEPYTATINNVTVSNCLGVASTDGSTSAGLYVDTYYYTYYLGTGSYPFSSPLITVTINYANITNCTTGVCVGYDEESYDFSSTTVSNSNFFGNTGDLQLIGMLYPALGLPSLTVSNNYYGGGAPVCEKSEGLSISGTGDYETEPVPGEQDTEVTAGVEPSYYIVIPAAVDFGTLIKDSGLVTQGFIVKAQSVVVEEGASIDVDVTTIDPMTDGHGNTLAYTLSSETDTDVIEGETFATFDADGTEDGNVSVQTNDIEVAGSYSGTMVFTISYN